MIDARAAKVLQDAARRESLSLLQYTREAFPWAESSQEDRIAAFQKLAEEDRQAIGELTQYLIRAKHPVSYVGSFPESFTCTNFVGFDHLLPRILQGQMASLANLEQKLQEMPECEARAQLSKFVHVKRKVLRQLEALSPGTTPAVAKAG